MTRRITIAILLSVWASVAVAMVAVYMSAREVLIDQFDRELAARAFAIEGITDSDGTARRAATHIHANDQFRIQNSKGQTLQRADAAASVAVNEDAVIQGSFTSLPGDRRLRTLVVSAFRRNGSNVEPVMITYRGDAAALDQRLTRLGAILGACGVLAAALAAVTARAVARVALKPLNQTASEIAAISDETLDRRLDADSMPVELKPIAEKLNEMLTRVDLAFQNQKRFVADAAHELRTPVAALLTALEVTLRRPREAEVYRTALESSLSDVRTLRHLVESLLLQVRAELRSFSEPMQDVELSGLLRGCADTVRGLASRRELDIACAPCDGVVAFTQPNRVRAAVLGILSNAIEYGRHGGHVDLHCSRDEHSCSIRVADDGPGIMPEHLPHIFEPFFRAQGGQTDETHLGLGLHLVSTQIKAVGGTVVVESQVGRGTTFTISLPIDVSRESSNQTARPSLEAA